MAYMYMFMSTRLRNAPQVGLWAITVMVAYELAHTVSTVGALDTVGSLI